MNVYVIMCEFMMLIYQMKIIGCSSITQPKKCINKLEFSNKNDFKLFIFKLILIDIVQA